MPIVVVWSIKKEDATIASFVSIVAARGIRSETARNDGAYQDDSCVAFALRVVIIEIVVGTIGAVGRQRVEMPFAWNVADVDTFFVANSNGSMDSRAFFVSIAGVKVILDSNAKDQMSFCVGTNRKWETRKSNEPKQNPCKYR